MENAFKNGWFELIWGYSHGLETSTVRKNMSSDSTAHRSTARCHASRRSTENSRRSTTRSGCGNVPHGTGKIDGLWENKDKKCSWIDWFSHLLHMFHAKLSSKPGLITEGSLPRNSGWLIARPAILCDFKLHFIGVIMLIPDWWTLAQQSDNWKLQNLPLIKFNIYIYMYL